MIINVLEINETGAIRIEHKQGQPSFIAAWPSGNTIDREIQEWLDEGNKIVHYEVPDD